MKAGIALQSQNPVQHPISIKTAPYGHYTALAGALCLLWQSGVQADLSDYQAAVSSEASLISYYTFEAATAADVHGTNNGTLMGTAAFASGVRDAGTALSLDGAGRVNFGLVQDFTFINDDTGSIEAWVQAGTLGGNACIVANRDGGTRYSVHLDSDKLGIGMWNGAAYFPTIDISNASTNWHHLVLVFDFGEFRVYWDGALAGSQFRVLGFTDPFKPTQLGSISPTSNNSENWVGKLDEVAFYSDALTLETIQAHYAAIFIGDPPVITKQPQGGTYAPGVNLTLNVTATGPQLSYQWFKGPSVMTGETASTLNFPSLAAGNAGTYHVVVSNSTAVVTSSNAVITVASLPTKLVSYQTAVSNEASLISYYTFDRLVPEDAHGPNDGALAGSAGWATGIGGGSAQGLRLDGAGRVDLGYVPDFDFPSGEGTVEAWVRADWEDSFTAYWPCMYANRSGGPTRWSLHLSYSKSTPSFYNGSGSSWFVLPGGAGTNWHHFATVFTNGTASFYVDGNLIQYSPMARELGTGTGLTVQLGSSASSSTSEGWIGMLDEVALYSTALPEASIQAHYNAFVAGEPPEITSQPVGGYFLVGQLGQLQVGASGAQLKYQWYQDDVLIPNATNAFIGPVVLMKEFSGNYYATVANLSGSKTSEVAVVQVGNNVARYQATVLSASNLLSYYTFDVGDTQDSTGAHPGTAVNVVAYGSGAGDVTNLSLTLDGGGHVDLGAVADFNFADGSGTVEAWIRPNWTNPAPYDPVPFANRDISNSVWSVHVSQWKTWIGNFAAGLQTLPIFSDGNWHHYAIVFDAGTVSMYWDGKPRGTFDQGIDSFLEKTTQLGSSDPTTTTEGWMGGLDEVAFYSDALEADTIWSHYLAMVGPTTPPTLSYSRAGTQLTLSWPPEETGWTLESADQLTATTWTPVGGVVNNQVTVDTSVGTQLYRLKK